MEKKYFKSESDEFENQEYVGMHSSKKEELLKEHKRLHELINNFREQITEFRKKRDAESVNKLSEKLKETEKAYREILQKLNELKSLKLKK